MYHIIEDIIILSSNVQAASPTTLQASEEKRPSCLHRAWQSAEHRPAGKDYIRDDAHTAIHTGPSYATELDTEETSKDKVWGFMTKS